MKILLAPTEDFIKLQKAQLTLDVAAGSSVVLTVINADGFKVNDFIVVGYEGSELAELCKITAVGATSMTVQTLVLGHKADEPITKYRFNQRKFYGATSSTGSYTELTGSGSPITIQVGDPQGTYCEYIGIEGYTYFKSTYFNSQSSEETAIGDAFAVQADESTRYTSLYSIKKQAGLTRNPFINDGLVETYRKRAENEINSYLMTRYTLPLTNSTGGLEVPAIVENCATLLAAGYMDYQEFGKDGEGIKWLGEARSIINAIKNGTQRLIGLDYQEMAFVSSSNQVQSYPDTTDNTNGPDRKFTMRQRF